MKARFYINPERNSSIELLRCLAMFFVVMSHASAHGVFPVTASSVSFNSFTLDWMTLGNLGTDIFVILSGCNLYGKKLRLRSVLNVIVQVWVISLLGLIVCGLSGYVLSIKDILNALFPIMSDSWWFATAYLVLLLLTPSINIFVENVNRKQFKTCLITMIVLWCFIPTLSKQDMYGETLLQMIMFYLLGAYLRKYPDKLLNQKKNAKIAVVITMILLFISSAVIRVFNAKIMMLPFKTTMLYGRTSVLIVSCALAMVSLAIYAPPFKNRLINTIGACTFGIYLLHEHPLIKNILWTKWIDNSQFFFI